MPVCHSISFPTVERKISLGVRPGEIILVAGPNGVGKSALLSSLFRSLPKDAGTYLPGHRQIYFNSSWDSIGQSVAKLNQTLFQQSEQFSRFKSSWAEEHFKSTLRKLLNNESAFNKSFRESVAASPAQADSATIKNSPLDTLNVIFRASRFPVRFILTVDGISVTRDSSIYSIDALSDGERAALFLAAAFIVQEKDTVLLIDEPEKHMHPSITGLFIESALRSRPDISVVLSTHDINLIERLKVKAIVHITDSKVISVTPERRVFSANVIQNLDETSDDLKRELLGARSGILFVEGEHSSEDIAIYTHVYKNFKISSKGGCEKVIESVKALRSTPNLHWISPHGIIDGDGRSAEEREKLATQGILCLPSPSIENLFFAPFMIDCFLQARSAYASVKSKEEYLEAFCGAVRNSINRDKNDIISRRVSWALERELSANKLSPRQIISNSSEIIEVSIPEIRDRISDEVEQIVSNSDTHFVMRSLPIKNTQVPHNACVALGAANFKEYCSVIIRQLDINTAPGVSALIELRRTLPQIDNTAQ